MRPSSLSRGSSICASGSASRHRIEGYGILSGVFTGAKSRPGFRICFTPRKSTTSAVQAGLSPRFLEPLHADPGGSLRGARTAPMSFEAHRVVVSIFGQGAQLAWPVDHSSADRLPFIFLPGRTQYIFCMAMPDALDRQEAVSIGIRRGAESGGVTRIPVEHEVLVGDGLEHSGCVFSGAGIARDFIFQQQDHVALCAHLRRPAQLFVDGGAIGVLIVEPPEVEAADAIGLKLLCEFNTVFEPLILLLALDPGMKLCALRTLLGKRRSGPVDFEQRTGNIRHPQLIFFEDRA